MGVAAASCMSIVGAMLLLRRQKVGRDTKACFGRLEKAGFQWYDTTDVVLLAPLSDLHLFAFA